MNWIIRIILVALVIAPTAGFAQRKKPPKPESVYITTAKIEVLSGDLERYATAMAYLDTLFLHYRPCRKDRKT